MLKKLRYGLLCFYLYYFVPLSYCDKDLEKYKKEIIQITKEHCNDNQYFRPFHQYIYFKKLKDNEIGECVIKFNTYKILVDPVFWADATEDDRWQLMAHEFAHCLLMKNHVDNKYNYMYYMIVPLGKETAKKQFITDLRSKCGR